MLVCDEGTRTSGRWLIPSYTKLALKDGWKGVAPVAANGSPPIVCRNLL